MESTSAIGREYVYRLKDDEMTMGRAVQENIASASQLRHRAQIADRNLSAVDAAFDEAALTTEALSADLSDAEAARRILGSSRTEFKDGVYQTTITLYKGASELTVLEEKIEGDARLMLEDGRKGWMISALRDVEETLETDASHLLKNGKREWMIKALRETEQQTGEQLLPKGVADTDLTVLQLKEDQ